MRTAQGRRQNAPIVIVVLEPIQEKRQACLHLPGHRVHRLWSVQKDQEDMWCCTSGLDLVGELERELKRLGHLEQTLAEIVKSDVCNGSETCGP